MASVIQSFLIGLYGFYNFLFAPILNLGPYMALGVFSAALAGLFSLIYWYLLDIEKADSIKEKINKHQDKMKEARKEEDTDKASNHMQKTMEFNQKLMMLNFKPMIATMVFVGLVFPWLGATFAPTVDLQQVGNQTYKGNFTYGAQSTMITVNNQTDTPTVIIGDEEAKIGQFVHHYGVKWDVTYFGDSGGGLFSIHNGKVLKLNASFVQLPFSLPLAGSALNWLGFYILIAMPLTFIFRKLLGVA